MIISVNFASKLGQEEQCFCVAEVTERF